MAEDYKRLGAVAPTDDKYKLLYTPPAATEALVSNITVTNRSASAQTFDVNVYESGVTQQSDVDDSVSNIFVSVANNYPSSPSNEASYSTDAITWTQTTLPDYKYWYDVTCGTDRFVTVSPYGTTAAYSTNGVTWTASTLPLSRSWQSITHGNGTFVTVGLDSNSAATSTDGITWTARTLPASTSWRAVAYGNGTFVAVARSTTIAASSTDGATWTQRTLPTSTGWHAVAYGNGTFVAINRGNIAATSTDGITWTQRSLPVNDNWYSIIHGGGVFVVVGYGVSTVLRSTDGITWTSHSLSNYAGFDVTYAGGIFFTGFYYSRFTSTDAITWTEHTQQSIVYSEISSHSEIEPYTPPTQTTLYKSSEISANSTEVLEPGIALAAQGAVVVKDNSGGNLTFSTYGVELS